MTPMDLANWTFKPAPLTSSRVNPLPSLVLAEYLCVGFRTIGLNDLMGLGKTDWAFCLLLSSLFFF